MKNYIGFMLSFMKEFYKGVFAMKANWLWILFMMTGFPVIVGTLLFLLGTKVKREEVGE